jgi:hypothetical protein
MSDRGKQLTKQLLKEQFQMVVSLSSRNRAHLNPVVWEEFKRIAQSPLEHVTLFLLDEAETKLGIFWAEEDEADALPITPSESEGTANISFSLLVAARPALKAPAGRVRLLPAKIDKHKGTPCLILDLMSTDVVPVRHRKKAVPDQTPS